MKLKDIVNQDPQSFGFRVNQELRKLATENPQFSYNPNGHGSCGYNSDCKGSPGLGCIFGRALQALGWSDPDELNSPDSISNLFDHCGLPDFRCHENWATIQYKQDQGILWGNLLPLIGE